jgi:hypothetical protein
MEIKGGSKVHLIKLSKMSINGNGKVEIVSDIKNWGKGTRTLAFLACGNHTTPNGGLAYKLHAFVDYKNNYGEEHCCKKCLAAYQVIRAEYNELIKLATGY